MQQEKLERFAIMLEQQQVERLRKQNLACEGNIRNSKVTLKPGNKYTKVDVGDSGKYMVDKQGNIFGIKSYGQVHKGHHYGTLDTIDNYYWGEYTARRKHIDRQQNTEE